LVQIFNYKINKNNTKSRRVSLFWTRKFVKTSTISCKTTQTHQLPIFDVCTTRIAQLPKSDAAKRRTFPNPKPLLSRRCRGWKGLFSRLARALPTWTRSKRLNNLIRNPLLGSSSSPTSKHLILLPSNLESFAELGPVHTFLQKAVASKLVKMVRSLQPKTFELGYLHNLSLVGGFSHVGFSWRVNVGNLNVSLNVANAAHHHLTSNLDISSLNCFFRSNRRVSLYNWTSPTTKSFPSRITTSGLLPYPILSTIEPSKLPILGEFYNYNSFSNTQATKLNQNLPYHNRPMRKLGAPYRKTGSRYHALVSLRYYRGLAHHQGAFWSAEGGSAYSSRGSVYASKGGRRPLFTETRYLLSLVGRYFSRQSSASLSKNKLIGNNRFKLFAFHFTFKKYVSSMVHRGYFVDNQFDWFDSAWSQSNRFSRVDAYTAALFSAESWSSSLLENTLVMNPGSFGNPWRVVEPGSSQLKLAQSNPNTPTRVAKTTVFGVAPSDLRHRFVVKKFLLNLGQLHKSFTKMRKFKRSRRLKWSTIDSTTNPLLSKEKRLFVKALKRFTSSKFRYVTHASNFITNVRILQLLVDQKLKKVERQLSRHFKRWEGSPSSHLTKFKPRLRYKLGGKLRRLQIAKRYRGRTSSLNTLTNPISTLLNRNLLASARVDSLSPLTEGSQTRIFKPLRAENPKELLPNVFFYNESLLTPLVFKYALVEVHLADHTAVIPANKITPKFTQRILRDYIKFFFGSRHNQIFNSNVIGISLYPATIKRRLIKVFRSRKFDTKVMLWNYSLLGRFMEHCTGYKIYLKLNPWVDKSLRAYDQALARVWYSRVAIFQRMLGPRIFLHESIKIIMIALKYKDPMFLCNWIRAMLYRMSFYKYRLLFRYLKYVIGSLLEPSFPDLGLRGFKLRLKGKICVAGNARTRKLVFKVGSTSHSRKSNKVIHHHTLINSFTGVMGFNLWIFF